MKKRCIKCNQIKNISDFTKCSSHSDGLSVWCRACIHEYNQKYYTKNSGKIKEYVGTKYHENPEPKREYQINYRLHNPEKVKRSFKNWKNKNSERCKEYNKNWHNKNYVENIQYHLKCKYRARINSALRHRRLTKYEGTIKLLGCSYDEFKKHIESQFTIGMTWEKVLNGKIHIDHILPLAMFDLSKEHDRKIAFNYRNCQPLWCVDNLSKGSKILQFKKGA